MYKETVQPALSYGCDMTQSFDLAVARAFC